MAEVELGGTLRLSDIVLPKGVESVVLAHGEGHDHPVVSVTKIRTEEELEALEAAEAAAEEGAEVPVAGEESDEGSSSDE